MGAILSAVILLILCAARQLFKPQIMASLQGPQHQEQQPPEAPDPPPKITTTWRGRHIQTYRDCRCSTDPATRELVAGLDPLVASAFHNQTCTPLHRLPTELALDIMERLDPLGVQSLRRTCRLFLRLYSSSPSFAPTFAAKEDRPRYFPWATPRRNYGPVRQLKTLLDRDLGGYCADCRAARESPAWRERFAALTERFLHCSKCGRGHIAALFSAGERHETDDARRVCIGHEGYVRLCSHRVVRWSDVWPISLGLATVYFGGNRAVVTVAECKHPSHLPSHHHEDSVHLWHRYQYPTVLVEKEDSSDSGLHLRFHWRGHLRVPDDWVDQCNEYWPGVTPDHMQRELKKFRLDVGEYIIPEFAPGRLLEMACFDPNTCTCLRFPGIENLPHGWHATPIEHTPYDHPSCRQDKSRRLRLFDACTVDEIPITLGYRSSPNDGDGEDLAGSHNKSTRTTAYGGINLASIHPCMSGRCLRVHYLRQISLWASDQPLNRHSMAWYEALDPDSYHLTNDMDSFGILWCRQQGCKNYHRYPRRCPVPPGGKVHSNP